MGNLKFKTWPCAGGYEWRWFQNDKPIAVAWAPTHGQAVLAAGEWMLARCAEDYKQRDP